MRKVTSQIRDAWLAGRSKTVGNTTTDGSSVYLHGNEVIRLNGGGNSVQARLAGWNTPTTRERLKMVSENGSGRFTQRDFEPLLDGKPICDRTWYDVGYIWKGKFIETPDMGLMIPDEVIDMQIMEARGK